MSVELWLASAISFALAAVLPFVIRPVLRRVGAVDVPNERSSHTAPTLRGGGLAPLLAWNVALLTSIVLGNGDAFALIVVLVATNFAAAVGFIDDLVSLRAGVRLALQLLIGLGAGVAIVTVASQSVWWAVVGMVVVAGYINVANFIDGINGISGAHGITSGLAYAIAGVISDQPWLAIAGAALAAAFVAFLPWNLRSPSLFLGDVGSYFLGAAVGVTALLALSLGVSPLLVVPVVAPWLADTSSVVVRRFIRGEGVLSAHRTHAYQRLTDTGLGHGTVAIIAAAFSMCCAVLGYLAWRASIPVWLGLLGIVLLCAVYLLLPRWRGSRLTASIKEPLAAPDEVIPAPAAAGSRTRWVVYGASGFVGTGIVSYLRERGLDVREIAAPRLAFGTEVCDGSAIQEAAEDDPIVGQLVDQMIDADVVVNAAGMASPDGDVTRELWGANAYLPAVLAHASRRAGATRFIHLSSAAVQGRTRHLDETPRYAPFSPYSRSKAVGEIALLSLAASDPRTGVVIVRATSVQGQGRATTQKLRRLASSPFASVAAPGTQPSVVSSLHGLAAAVETIGTEQGPVPGIVLQPWEGMSVTDVLLLAGGRKPLRLPRWICALILAGGYVGGRAVPQISGIARRLEMMWFGQSQDSGWADGRVLGASGSLRIVLESGAQLHDND